MSKKLTPQQQQFLDRLLSVRPQAKGRLGGRQLDKVKDQFADYLRRRRKTEEAIAALEQAHGKVHGESMRRVLDRVTSAVTAAADTGDETVFKTAYEQLESVKKDARQLLENLNAQAKEIASASEKLEQALVKLKSADPGKRAALAKLVVDSCMQWLGKHPGAVAPRINVVLQEAQSFTGVPMSREQGLALGTQLESETLVLCREIDAVVDDDLFVVADTVKDYTGQMARLAQRLQRALGEARASGSVVAVKQIERSIAQLERTQLRADPPPLVDAPQQPPVQQGGVQPQAKPEDANTTEALLRLLDAPIGDLDDGEQAERALFKGRALIQQLTDEVERVSQGMADGDEALRTLRTEFATLQDFLDGDFALMADSLSDATAALLEARERLADALKQVQLGEAAKGRKGEWRDGLELVATACDMGLANVATADKSMGRAEGGVTYIRAKAGNVADLPGRLRAFDEAALDALDANVKVLPKVGRIAFALDDDQRDLLRHLVFVSADAAACSSLLDGIRDARSFDAAVKGLMKLPKLGTVQVTGLLNDCHRFIVDAERLYGESSDASRALGNDLSAKFNKVRGFAKLDLGRYTMPVIPRPRGGPVGSVGVAVVGGGPIGLLAAVEARMAGASQVHVYEGRNDPYSRMNVLKLDNAAMQRLRTAGVFEQICPNQQDNIASVKTIESALEQRCNTLGIKLERDRFLVDVQRDDKGVVQLTFKGDPQPKPCDVLIVATGGSVAGAQKHANNVVLGDKLGIPFQKSEVKDYAAVGLFGKNAPKPDTKGLVDGWTYQFETQEVKYIVTQLTEEEFKDWGDNPRKLIEHLQRVAGKTQMAPEQQMAPESIDPAHKVASVDKDAVEAALDTAWNQLMRDFGGVDNFFGRNRSADEKVVAKCRSGAKVQLERTLQARASKGEEAKVSPAEVEKSLMNFLIAEFGVGRFPIELQQAKGFTSAKHEGVLVGDSAGTPHPETAKGLNTGIAEMGAMRDLVQDLMMGGGDEEQRKKSMQVYDFEVKRRTDAMVAAGLYAMQKVTGDRLKTHCVDRAKPVTMGWSGGLTWFGEWSTAFAKHLKDTYYVEQDVRDDRDWAKREAAIKKLRSFLPVTEAAVKELVRQAQLVRGPGLDGDVTGQPLPAAVKKPLEDLLAL
ncbi:MAG: FAD-dependent monooxygenase [Paucibacter sp.]|nr:FAD-dependent monooxygenase [Roseateles sp.]